MAFEIDTADDSTLVDYQAIGEKSPEALALVANLMQRSAEETDRIQDSLLEQAYRERDEWKTRALKAELAIERARDRLDDLFFGPA
jgi:hypothetical protein